MPKQWIVCIAEEVSEVREMEAAEAQAYLDGFTAGGNEYGAGACGGVLLPQDWDSEFLTKQHRKDIVAIVKKMGRDPTEVTGKKEG